MFIVTCRLCIHGECVQQNVAGPFVTRLPHGAVLWFAEKPVPAVGATVGGAVGVPIVEGLKPKVPMGEDDAAGAGTVISGLTPALPISTDPKGIPAREGPLGDADGADAVGEAVPVAHGAALPSEIPPPTVSPPPSYVLTPEMPPDIPVDALPPSEHVEAIMPAGSVNIGLMPGEMSSVAPSGMSVGPTNAPDCEPPVIPSGEVAAMPGVGTLIPPT